MEFREIFRVVAKWSDNNGCEILLLVIAWELTDWIPKSLLSFWTILHRWTDFRLTASGHTLWLMAPGHALEIDGPRPYTLTYWMQPAATHFLSWWPQATHFRLMAPGHTLSVDGLRPHTLGWWPQATHFTVCPTVEDGPKWKLAFRYPVSQFSRDSYKVL